MFFYGIPQKERCWPYLDCHSEGIAKHLISIQTSKARTYDVEHLPLLFDGYILLNWRFFRIHQARGKTPLFQYVCLNFYFVVNHFILTQIYNKFVVNKILIINLFEVNPYCITCSGYTLPANVMF